MDAKTEPKKPVYMPRKRDKEKKPLMTEPELSMTPMIDCVFQLLIFFMLTGKFVSTEGKLSAYLPKDRGQEKHWTPEKMPDVRVLLRWNPTIARCKVYVGQVLCNYDQEGMQRALTRVRQLKQTGSARAEIDAGGDVPMVWIVQALNMLILAGVPEINFTGAMNPLEDNR